jgi:hypothetical protein
MLDGKITTLDYPGGVKVHRGECVASKETITAADCLSAAVPDQAPGIIRETILWVSEAVADGPKTWRSSCRFELRDRPVDLNVGGGL